MILIHPTSNCAVFAEELTTCFAIVLDVFEVKLRTASRVLTICRILGSKDEFLSFRLGGQIKWCMFSGIPFVQVDTSRKIALEDFEITRSRSLMYTGIAIHIYIEW